MDLEYPEICKILAKNFEWFFTIREEAFLVGAFEQTSIINAMGFLILFPHRRWRSIRTIQI